MADTPTPGAIIADFPAYAIVAPDPAKNWTDGEEFGIAFQTRNHGTLWHFFKLGSAEDFYAKDAAPKAAIERSKAAGHAQHFAFGLGASLTAWKRDKLTRVGFEYGATIQFRGKTFRLDKAPNDNVTLVEVAGGF